MRKSLESRISLDVIGARFTVCFGLLISIISIVLLALGDFSESRGISFIAGYSRIGFGGYGFYINAFQFVLHLPLEGQGLISSFLPGFFNFSCYLGRKDLWFFDWISTINAFIGGAIPNIIYKNNDGDDGTDDLYVNYV
ncbi:hypothetical protein BBO99_00000410 [Phytophthora kernoviae]|uniref:Uncharacterized protein n=2 Tax=Phytophthora kernoviae TaxID=325452 RepID=A0A3R7KZ28_9STRA|nr:hypothetical protein G195_001208 [Phytophthora kernoviae 00238/432]KAG2532238.1 hypothetical protein JM16_000461 [Phytophthora kernoviae]KAG2533293.1 hypothetical protein JM18_000509 [Phytophthora kernoviae]RLN14573.1 hypothetical protein BBI17_000407 [Phytophthora kernoviae]RLN85652.1 hypothetical protein BBO99_00000410 [Phytophthora kernoviae]